MKMRILAMSVLLLVQLPAYAGGWISWVSVQEINLDRWALLDPGVEFTVSAYANPDGCSGTGQRIVLRKSHSGFKEIYALLTTAKATNKLVSLYVDGCDDNGTHQPVLRHFWLAPNE